MGLNYHVDAESSKRAGSAPATSFLFNGHEMLKPPTSSGPARCCLTNAGLKGKDTQVISRILSFVRGCVGDLRAPWNLSV